MRVVSIEPAAAVRHALLLVVVATVAVVGAWLLPQVINIKLASLLLLLLLCVLLQVVVATVAFGMGVDKADIELVVHMNLPR